MYNRVLFLGSKLSGLEVLKKIYQIKPSSVIGCITIDDVEDLRSVFREFEVFCSINKIPMEVVKGSCNIKILIDKYRPDLCIVMGWYYLIDSSIIKNVRGGFIGIHNSLLPRYRGFSPVVWAIINGEKETGFSVFSFDEGMDTGQLWYQGRVTIEDKDYINTVLEKINQKILIFFQENYLDLLDEKLCPYEQKAISATYGSRRTAEDGKIKWNQPAKNIYNFIRAQSKPYPGAFSFYDNKKIIIWKASIFSSNVYGTPGQVCMINKEEESVIVVCGENSGLILKEVEMDSKKIKPANIPVSLNKKFE